MSGVHLKVIPISGVVPKSFGSFWWRLDRLNTNRREGEVWGGGGQRRSGAWGVEEVNLFPPFISQEELIKYQYNFM